MKYHAFNASFHAIDNRRLQGRGAAANGTARLEGGGGLRKGTLEGEQQAIMSTRPLPFKPSYNSLVSVLSLYGITGGTELQQKHTCFITMHCHCHCHYEVLSAYEQHNKLPNAFRAAAPHGVLLAPFGREHA